jgi:glutathione synthase
MAYSVGVQMDPIDAIDIDADSTFAMALEAQNRGHELFYYLPGDLGMRDRRVFAHGHALTLARKKGAHFEIGARETRDLAHLDVILLRQDPPFHMGYITTTHLLDRVHPDTLVVNDPTWVRNYPEKILVTEFTDLTPATLITRNLDDIRAFGQEHKGMILKPLYGNGGAGVFKLDADLKNLTSLHEMFVERSAEPLIAQAFLPDVTKGDKRVILVDGEPVGAINRVPAKGETRSNMHVGGRPEKVALTDRDREICARIGPLLREKGQIFVGIDVIGDYLTEINVTSPTGIQELSRFDGIDVPGMIWDAIERRLQG